MHNDIQPEEEHVTGIIVDERTKQPIPQGIERQALGTNITPNLDLAKVGTLNIGADAKKVLDEPMREKDVLIRPDGLIYVDWTWFADRLSRAFGRGCWGLIPQGSYLREKDGTAVLVVWPHWLVIKGVPISMGVGECTFYPSNHTMSLADALEGAKSIALARACKVLGMNLELWDKEWIDAWKEKYAETYVDPKTKKTLWRKKKDLVVAGKRRLVEEVKDWYPNAAAIQAVLEELKLTYSLENHNNIRKALIEYHFHGNVIDSEPAT